MRFVPTVGSATPTSKPARLRTQTVAEDISVNDRRRVFFEMTEGLMAEVNAQLEDRIREHLAKYLR